MYYEEEFIDGVWYYRTTPRGEWKVKPVQVSWEDSETQVDEYDVINGLLRDMASITLTEKLLIKCVIEWVFKNYKLEEK